MHATNDNTNCIITARESGKLSTRKLNLILRGVAQFVNDARTVLTEGLELDSVLVFNKDGRLPLKLELSLRMIAVQVYVSQQEPDAERVDGHVISPLYFSVMAGMLKQFVLRHSYRPHVRKMDQFEMRVTGQAVPSEALFAALMGLVEERIPEWKAKSLSESTGA